MILCLCVCVCVGGLRKRIVALPALLSGRNLPPISPPMPDNSVPPCMFLVPFNLLPPCWSSEGVSLSKSVHGPFKRNCQGILSFLSSTSSIPTGFYSHKLWWPLFWHWNAGLGGLLCSWDPSFRRYPSQFLSATHGCGSSQFCISVPPTSLVVSSLTLYRRTSIQLGIWWFWMMVVLWVSCKFYVVVWGGELCLPTPPSILTGSGQLFSSITLLPHIFSPWLDYFKEDPDIISIYL